MDSHSPLMFLYSTQRKKSNHVAENVSMSAQGERLENLLYLLSTVRAILGST